VLYLGGADPRKNVATLLAAFADHVAPRAPGLRLVVAGAGLRDAASLGPEAAERLRRAGDAVHVLDAVPDDALAALYAGAAVFVFPSLHEGFGLPPLEAMACGAPVVSSDRGALREVLGDAPLYVDALAPAAIADAILAVAADPALAHRLAERGRAQAARYSWDATARGLLAAIEEAAASRR
jgi:glycosyltransferase involved in cell wall biosynthesis